MKGERKGMKGEGKRNNIKLQWGLIGSGPYHLINPIPEPRIQIDR